MNALAEKVAWAIVNCKLNLRRCTNINWISDKVNQAFFDTINKIATDVMTWAFSLVMDLIMNLSDLSAYFDYSIFVMYSKTIAGSLLITVIVFEVLKNMSGNVFSDTKDYSVSTYAGKILFAVFFIFFLPWSVQHIFMRFNIVLIDVIKSIPSTYELSSSEALISVLNPQFGHTSWAFVVITLAIVISFVILGFMAGIRYIELIVCIIFAPLVAVSFIKNSEKMSIWVRETASITFTQVFQVMLLKILTICIGTTHNLIVLPLLVIGILVVMIRGPQILRQFLYSTGVGSSSVGAVGSASRMAAMKFVMKR